MKIEEGKWYRCRDGHVVGPARSVTSLTDQSWAVGVRRYRTDGRFYGDQEHYFDLVDESPEPTYSPGDALAAVVSDDDPNRMTKAKLLDLAKEAVAGRGLNYGKPEDNFERIARRWAVHFKNRYDLDVPVDAIDVAQMCADIKLARLEHQPDHLDSWTDLAGYAACGAEISA